MFKLSSIWLNNSFLYDLINWLVLKKESFIIKPIIDGFKGLLGNIKGGVGGLLGGVGDLAEDIVQDTFLKFRDPWIIFQKFLLIYNF